MSDKLQLSIITDYLPTKYFEVLSLPEVTVCNGENGILKQSYNKYKQLKLSCVRNSCNNLLHNSSFNRENLNFLLKSHKQ